MNKKIIVALVAVLIIALVGWKLPVGNDGQTIVEKLGAFPGPDIDSSYLNVNGVMTVYKSMAFNTASTTRCAIQAPTTATSTLSTDSIVKAATTTDYTLAIAKSATAYATTTLIRSETVTANGQVAFPMASTTVQALTDTNRTFAPGEWLVVSAAGPTATAFSNGYCAAIFNVGR